MKTPLLSVIIPYCNKDKSRIPALNVTLDCLKAQDFMIVDSDNNPTKDRNFEVIFIEQAYKSDYEPVDDRGIADKHIVIPHEGEFNKSWLMNIGAREASTHILVYIDADMIFGKEYLYFVNLWRMNTHPNPRFFVGWDWIIKLPGKDEPIARMVRTTALTAGGCFWVDKEFFWEVGGMNENYFGYGGEDNDFWIRANCIMGRKNLKNVLNAPYPMAHTYHDSAIPSPERFYPLNRTIQHPDKVVERLKTTNLGNPKGPTKIKISDLILKESGIEDGKDAKGIAE